jgi:hypothetical protein
MIKLSLYRRRLSTPFRLRKNDVTNGANDSLNRPYKRGRVSLVRTSVSRLGDVAHS